MDNFINLMTMILNFLKTPFSIWGVSFSFWGVFITVSLLSLVFWFISSLFSD